MRLVPDETRLLIRTDNILEKNAFFSLSVPGLEWTKITEEDWDWASARRAGQQLTVRDEKYIYSSTTELDITRITRVDVHTLTRETIYEEPLPVHLRPKRERGETN